MSKNTKEELTVEAPIMEAPVATKKQTKKIPEWEVKDRVYLLKGNTEPLTYTLGSKHTRRYPLLWFDPLLAPVDFATFRYIILRRAPSPALTIMGAFLDDAFLIAVIYLMSDKILIPA